MYTYRLDRSCARNIQKHVYFYTDCYCILYTTVTVVLVEEKNPFRRQYLQHHTFQG